MIARNASAPCGDVVLDFSNATILTGVTLGKLVRLHKKLRERGQALVLRNVNETLFEVLEVTGLTLIMKVYPKRTNRIAGLG